MKKVFTLVWSVLALLMVTNATQAQTQIPDSDLYWKYADGTLTISGTGEIPDYPKVDMPWYNSKYDIEEVVIASGVTRIGTCAFLNFPNITKATIAKSVTSIGEGAFQNCENLTTVDSFDGVETIDMIAFMNTALTTIKLPAVKSIRYAAFEDCGNLTSVELGKVLTNIESMAFSNCIKLSEVTVHNPVPVSIHEFVFSNVDKEEVTLNVPAGSEAAYRIAPIWQDFFIKSSGSTPVSDYHTITLEVAAGIDLHSLTAGKHTVAEGGHLFLQFLPEDRTLGANDVLFLIDGIETDFNAPGTGYYYSYILNPVEADHTVLIALREYPVVLPEVEGIQYNVGSGTHRVGYGEKFTFTLTLDDNIDPAKVHVYANGIEIQPDGMRAMVLTYTIDSVMTPVTIVIEGAGDGTTGNVDLAGGKINITVESGKLKVESEKAVDVAVYTITGKNVVQLRALRGSESISLQPGVYLVKAGNGTWKVMIND